MVYNGNHAVAIAVLLACAGCVDLSAEGKVFACDDGPCEQTPPSVQCACDAVPAQCDGMVLVSTSTPSCLADGGCIYQRTETQCPSTCTAGACDGERCLGIVCDVPPRAECLDAHSLRGYTAQGTCSDGACQYAHVDVSCTCEGGRCLDNLCLGVNCTVPPASTCSGNAAHAYQAMGTCDGASGACSYSYADTTCPNGCVAGMCQPPACSPATCPNGCCSGNTCLPAAGQSASACGTAGANCGACSGNQSCTAGQCVACTGESDAALCAAAGRSCGSASATDRCGVHRTLDCGTCAANAQCGTAGACIACAPESDPDFCSRLGKNCGAVSATDNCGAARNASCGSCSSGLTCGSSNVCGCSAETDAAFCARLGKSCGPFSGTDNCGSARTASCGSCTQPQTCGGGGTSNVCGGPSRLSFSSSWQTLPNTGSATLEFRCVGTVSGTGSSTRCDGSDGVSVRINGTVYTLYPGCDGNRNNCVDTTPSGATYADDDVGAGGRLLCAAMGWSLNNSSSDENAGTTDRDVTVIQTDPTIYGTGVYKNYLSYVDCEP